jgi:hypothetical protein
MTQTHLAGDPAVVYVLRVAHDPLQKGHQGETVCLRHADVYDSCETRGETGLCVVGLATSKEGKDYLPLKWGSRLSSLWRFPFPSPCEDAARFSMAKRSRPRVDTLGVGGSRGAAGLRNVCCWHMLCTTRLEKRDKLTIFLCTRPPCRTGSGWRTSVSCPWSISILVFVEVESSGVSRAGDRFGNYVIRHRSAAGRLLLLQLLQLIASPLWQRLTGLL